MSDIVTRLWGNTANYPGFENIKTEAARAANGEVKYE